MSAVPETIHPDGWHPGLKFGIKTLNIKTVTRAAIATEVLPVCLSHNLRSGNTLHRHRSLIDPLRTHLNTVLLGSDDPAIASECASNILEELGITARRADAIMAIEMVFQPPDGWDRPEFWYGCLLWVRTRYQYIVSAVVHRDQKRPHMHVLALPILDGKLAGAAMTSHANRSQAQRADFLAFMLETLGLRPTEKRRTNTSVTSIFISADKGPKTRAEAARRNADLERFASARIASKSDHQHHHATNNVSSTSILRTGPLGLAPCGSTCAPSFALRTSKEQTPLQRISPPGIDAIAVGVPASCGLDSIEQTHPLATLPEASTALKFFGAPGPVEALQPPPHATVPTARTCHADHNMRSTSLGEFIRPERFATCASVSPASAQPQQAVAQQQAAAPVSRLTDWQRCQFMAMPPQLPCESPMRTST